MILEFRLPLLIPHMSEALIECLYAVPDATLKAGDRLVDLRVDLSSAFSQDCPPISYFRIILRENAILREFRLNCGQYCKVGELIAEFSSVAEGRDPRAPRGVRFATAGIMHHQGMWTAQNR